MISVCLLIAFAVNTIVAEQCYWNAKCPYLLYSTKNIYDTVRGDIRDQPDPENCQAISVWSLNRHGNRNPGSSVTEAIKAIADLKDEIIASHEAGRSQLCTQDIENFRSWIWNSTLEVSQSFLTGTGYEEIYDIAKRIRQRFPHLLQDSEDKYYFRCTNEQRTVTSAMAFVHGLADGTNLNLTFDGPWPRDDIIRPYQNCDKYQVEVRGGQELPDQLDAYYATAEFVNVRNAVQQRLGITHQLTSDEIYSLYEICRFYRSWEVTQQSPWCAVFSDQDLIILEYRDDVRHYYRNGYGSWVNVNLGGPVIKDLYENFEAAVRGEGRNIVAYFTHDTMLEMAYCAMGLFKDPTPLQGSTRNPDRLWRTSYIASFSVNIIAVLNRCNEKGVQTYRVKFYESEKESTLCPGNGCTWEEFQEKFQPFTSANLDFCSLDYPNPLPNNAVISAAVYSGVILAQLLLLFFNCSCFRTRC